MLPLKPSATRSIAPSGNGSSKPYGRRSNPWNEPLRYLIAPCNPICSRRAAWIACAASRVGAISGVHPGSTAIESGARPYSTALAFSLR